MMSVAPRPLHERWTVRIVAVVLSGLLAGGMAFLSYFMVEGNDSVFTVLWAIALFFAPAFAIPTWIFGRSRALPWVMLLYPLLSAPGDFWLNSRTDPGIQIIILFMTATGYVVFGWLAVVDDDGHLSRPARVVVIAFFVYAYSHTLASTLTWDPLANGWPARGWWTLFPNPEISDVVLPAVAGVVAGWVFPLVLLCLMIWEAIRGSAFNRIFRWLLVVGWIYLIIWDQLVTHAENTSGFGLAAEIFAGLTDQLFIPGLVVLMLVRNRRAEQRASAGDGPAPLSSVPVQA